MSLSRLFKKIIFVAIAKPSKICGKSVIQLLFIFSTMNKRFQAFPLVLIAWTVCLATPRDFNECEFTEELLKQQNISENEVYKHLCVGSGFNTTSHRNIKILGNYGGSDWWCKTNETDGSCNVNCHDLNIDDVPGAVACANRILSLHGLQGWERTEKDCIRKFEENCPESGSHIIVSVITPIITYEYGHGKDCFRGYKVGDPSCETEEDKKEFPVFIAFAIISISIFIINMFIILIVALVKYQNLTVSQVEAKIKPEELELETSFEA